MITVPKGKKVFIAGRRFAEGDVIPQHIAIKLPIEKAVKSEVKKPIQKKV